MLYRIEDKQGRWEYTAPKVCYECQKEKSYDAFEKNQFGKDNRILRRPVCKECRAKKKPISPDARREYEKHHPRPAIGDQFKCPLCERVKTVYHKNHICLDHDHETGAIRGYICGSCNASLGKFHHNIVILERAIEWVKGTLQTVLIVCVAWWINKN